MSAMGGKRTLAQRLLWTLALDFRIPARERHSMARYLYIEVAIRR